MTRPPTRPSDAARLAASALAAACWRVLGPASSRCSLGISLGRALEDGPSPGGTQTNVRTLEPQPLPPAARR